MKRLLTYSLSLLTWLTAGCSARLLSERVVQRDVRSTSGSRDPDDVSAVRPDGKRPLHQRRARCRLREGRATPALDPSSRFGTTPACDGHRQALDLPVRSAQPFWQDTDK